MSSSTFVVIVWLPGAKGREVRVVPLSDALAALLKPWLLKRHGPLVLGRPGMVRWTLAKETKAACRRAGIALVVFHDLRHTAASHWALAGMSLLEIGKLLGHKSPGTTMRYAHLCASHIIRDQRAHLAFTIPEGKMLTLSSGTVGVA